MEKKAKFETPGEAETFLSRNRVKVSNKVITLNGNHGLKVLSAVDYLTMYHGYISKAGH